jgi:hypothetical protein
MYLMLKFKVLYLYTSNIIALYHCFYQSWSPDSNIGLNLKLTICLHLVQTLKCMDLYLTLLYTSSWDTQVQINFNFLTGVQKAVKDLRIVCLLPGLKLGTFHLKVTSVTLSTDVVGVAVLRLPRTQNWTRDLAVKNKYLTTQYGHSEFVPAPVRHLLYCIYPIIVRQSTVCGGPAGIVDYTAVINPRFRRWPG